MVDLSLTGEGINKHIFTTPMKFYTGAACDAFDILQVLGPTCWLRLQSSSYALAKNWNNLAENLKNIGCSGTCGAHFNQLSSLYTHKMHAKQCHTWDTPI